MHAKTKTIKENNQFDLAAKEPTKMPKEKKKQWNDMMSYENMSATCSHALLDN